MGGIRKNEEVGRIFDLPTSHSHARIWETLEARTVMYGPIESMLNGVLTNVVLVLIMCLDLDGAFFFVFCSHALSAKNENFRCCFLIKKIDTNTPCVRIWEPYDEQN